MIKHANQSLAASHQHNNMRSKDNITGSSISPGESFELGVVLGVEEGGVVGVLQVLVHVLGVLLEAPLEPIPGPLQGVLDLHQ